LVSIVENKEEKMNTGLRLVMLTGNGLRHRFAASKLAEKANLVGIISEAKTPVVSKPELLPTADQLVIKQHFTERDKAEPKLLGAISSFPDTKVIEVPNSEINTPFVFDWVKNHKPDVIVLYGTSIIKPPLLDSYPDRIVNLHLGLSPYYRGSGTNFWPLVDRRPECVGATIHLAVRKVDAGAILAQIRPPIKDADRAHELGTKTIMKGFDNMPLVLDLYLNGKIKPQAQNLSDGCVYQRKDFNADAVQKMWHNFETGMIAEFLADSEARCRHYPIIEEWRQFA